MATLITWPFAGTIFGLVFGALFGGRGGMVFVAIGLAVGALAGIARSLYLGFHYEPSSDEKNISATRLLVNRIFIVLLYLLAVYTVIINAFFSEL